METYKSMINSGVFYLITAVVLLFITVMCFVFLVKSYRAGIKLGMDKAVLRKTISLFRFSFRRGLLQMEYFFVETAGTDNGMREVV